jgi:glycosyltransferase involved in cell wall biosynthesis
LTTYNRGGYLTAAINSVCNQSFRDWELIIIDDGSVDNTSEVAGVFAANEKIRYERIKHCGHIKAKNYGIRIAGGQYVTFLDSDDEYKREHLENYYKILENDEIDLLYSFPIIIGDEYVPDLRHPGRMIHIDECAVGGTFAVKREILLYYDGFPLVDYGEDAVLLEKLRKDGRKIFKSEKRTYIYNRQINDSITKRRN